ncbi:MAG: HAD family hydrolase [Planctomycetota bacterium]|jgi:FMN phosphatase YigB (HAD superfamily)
MRPCVIFDLDDTLIDTRGTLLPAALKRVSRALGLPVESLNARGKAIDEVLETVEGLSEGQRRAAAEAWYAPEVPSLEPLPGAKAVLDALRGRAHLVLLTRGDPARQRLKIERSGLGELFDEIIVRPIEGSGSKRDDLRALLAKHRSCAVVGDDERDELRYALELGCVAIQVPDTPLEEIPDRLVAEGHLPPAGSGSVPVRRSRR